MNSRLYSTLKSNMKMSESQKIKISNSCLGISKSEETKKKMSAWQKGRPKPYLRNRTITENQLIKMSAWQKGRPKPQVSGEKNGKSKTIKYNGVVYGSIRECSIKNNISKYMAIKNRDVS